MFFLGGIVDKNLPVNAGTADSNPDPGRSHMPRSKFDLCTTTTELEL